jgi:hypothetical protein
LSCEISVKTIRVETRRCYPDDRSRLPDFGYARGGSPEGASRAYWAGDWFAGEGAMKFVHFAVLSCLGLAATHAWAAQPILLQARTAGELAALCAVSPETPGADAKINYCHGFAQGAVDDRLRVDADKRPFCFPSPAPSRTSTMHEFASWVHADASRREMPVLDGLFTFLHERFPCRP